MPIFPLIMAALGAGAMYLLDPDNGKRRREQLQEQVNKLQSQAQTMVDQAQQDMNTQIDNRTHYSNTSPDITEQQNRLSVPETDVTENL